jgi:hypothetical protein
MHADIEIHNAAMSLTPHFLWASVVGARSGLPWTESLTDVGPATAAPGSIATAGEGLDDIDKFLRAIIRMLRYGTIVPEKIIA